jgi:hypothetical protein
LSSKTKPPIDDVPVATTFELVIARVIDANEATTTTSDGKRPIGERVLKESIRWRVGMRVR